MIVGIGTDILQTDRMSAALKRTPRLPERILTPEELEKFRAHRQPEIFLAKRFAAKEAAVKALGIGIGRGISWQHFAVVHDEWGKPSLEIRGGAAERAESIGCARLHLSYSDERDYVVAFVVAESE